jgi:hypothetical protein
VRWRGRLILAGLAFLVFAVFQLPFVPAQLQHCVEVQGGKEQCARYDTALVLLWETGEFLQNYNGAIIAVFTAVLAWSTIRLWRETERLAKGADQQSVDMGRYIAQAARSATAMESFGKSAANQVYALNKQSGILADSLRAANKTAEAASRQARLAEQSFYDLERPYVAVSAITCGVCNSAGEEITYGGLPNAKENSTVDAAITVTLTNFGRTPASVEVLNMFYLRQREIPTEFDVTGHNRLTYPRTLASDGKLSEENAVYVQRLKILNGLFQGDRVFVFGLIKYRDVRGFYYVRRFGFAVFGPKRIFLLQGKKQNGEKRYASEKSGQFED